MFNQLIKKIKEADKITIFFHQRPDPDAFGSAWGLERWIRKNFSAEVAVAHKDLIIESVPTHLRGYCKDISDEFVKGSLGIVVDTANASRIHDPRWVMCNEIVKIDHHPNVDPYATELNIVDTTKGAAAEILLVDLLLAFKDKYESPIDSLIPLYTGLVTDTGRFKYKPSATTFQAAEWCVANGVNANEIYDSIYKRNLIDVKFLGHILSTAHFDEGIAYVILPKNIKEMFDIPEFKLKNVNALADIKGYPIWALTYFEQSANSWRVSIRSSGIKINHVATKFKGGGHDNASGATVENLDEFKQLVSQLKKLLN